MRKVKEGGQLRDTQVTSIPVQRATRYGEPHPLVPYSKGSRNNAILSVLNLFLLNTVAWHL
jgi:hypothetical protein